MKAVLVFCEGRHDVIFAQRSLGTHGGCAWVRYPIRKLPTPFGSGGAARRGIIATQFASRSLDDLTLQAAAHPKLPRFESIVRNTQTSTVFFLVSAHGQDQTQPILELLRSLDDTIDEQPDGTFDVSAYAAAFLFDANGEGVAATLARFSKSYGAHFGDLSNLEHGQWLETSAVPVGCFVFHKDTGNPTGTLEDHLAPMAKRTWPDRYVAAEEFLEAHRMIATRCRATRRNG